LKVLDLFSGIGGFSLGLERAGFETVAFCEIEEYPRKVLAKHWPDVPIYEDVRNVTREQLESDGITGIDVITGGFPCQDLSVAGKQAGITGERSGLWGELARIISEVRPRYAIVENVTALLSGDRGGWFGRVLGDLAEIGYDCEWHCIPAANVGAPHQRDRVWIVAYSNEIRCGNGILINRQHENNRNKEWDLSQNIKSGSQREHWIIQVSKAQGGYVSQSDFHRVDDGLQEELDRHRCLGNAVVPQIPELIGRAIMEAESD